MTEEEYNALLDKAFQAQVDYEQAIKRRREVFHEVQQAGVSFTDIGIVTGQSGTSVKAAVARKDSTPRLAALRRRKLVAKGESKFPD